MSEPVTVTIKHLDDHASPIGRLANALLREMIDREVRWIDGVVVYGDLRITMSIRVEECEP